MKSDDQQARARKGGERERRMFLVVQIEQERSKSFGQKPINQSINRKLSQEQVRKITERSSSSWLDIRLG